MDYEYITVTYPAEHIACVTLDRPERLNAINGKTLSELDHAIYKIAQNDDIRAWLLTGAPRPDGRPCFSAGVDLKAIGEGIRMDRYQGPQVTNAIDNMLKPSIAVIDGVASTGAVELALACDFRLVGERAAISDWHLKNLGAGLGAWGSPTRWLQLVNAARVKEIILTGKVIGPEEACEMGFATACYPTERLLNEALSMAQTICTMDPQGVATALAHIQQSDAHFRDHSLHLAEQLSGWLGKSASFLTRSRRLLQKQAKDRKDRPDN